MYCHDSFLSPKLTKHGCFVMLRKLSGPSIIVYSQPFDSFVLLVVLHETFKAFMQRNHLSKNDNLRFVLIFYGQAMTKQLNIRNIDESLWQIVRKRSKEVL